MSENVFVDYERSLALQDGKCAICGDGPSLRRKLAVDHDHKTKRIRGLLCHRCNMGLGLAEDSSVLLRAMADYLDRGGSGKPIVPKPIVPKPIEPRILLRKELPTASEITMSLRKRMIAALSVVGRPVSVVTLKNTVLAKHKYVTQIAKMYPKIFFWSQGLVGLTCWLNTTYEDEAARNFNQIQTLPCGPHAAPCGSVSLNNAI